MIVHSSSSRIENNTEMTVTEFKQACETAYPGAVVEECGGRYLAWESEEDAQDDDGSRAFASLN